MNVAVLSGKGGTGKTTVSTNLALALKANYIDCDVEEPNGFLFLKPQVKEIENVMVEYPLIEDSKCVSCGACVDVCQFNALAKVKDDIILFQKLCHGCGACEIACKYGAISYKKREIGRIEKGHIDNIDCSRGILNISEPMAVPVIRQLLEKLPEGINIIDCPPGTSCNVVNSLKYVDGAVLVTEPTEFGLHDLKIAVELVRMFNIPFGVVINKNSCEENLIKKYCVEEQIQMIGAIPYNREIAVIYSKGEIIYNNSKFKDIFNELAEKTKGVLKWN
ncbi:(4Fe-4S)-binding protein [Clostridium polyendosporum]|uniref:(4Fe-4S)-binding protein n=1 Tax=Clostridium polyendosporum TaxID=69208 RepID=A0A919RZI1_9CLOT|nr:ATP-binding protein [Clostridium polyendosporum]GIM29092.1 (4Fe-4S)-binding protein [Clostridium polyendosporum]